MILPRAASKVRTGIAPLRVWSWVRTQAAAARGLGIVEGLDLAQMRQWGSTLPNSESMSNRTNPARHSHDETLLLVESIADLDQN